MSEDKLRAIDNFRSALSKLEEFLSTPVTEDRDKAGIIQAFEYSFELCWKCIQKTVVEHNKTVGSPKQAFQAAFELGWIREADQEKWLGMANDRNLTSHTYKQALADQVLARIREQHLSSLKSMLTILQKQ